MEAAAPYSRRLSRQYPGLFIILIDQSGSMGEQVVGQNTSKADYAATALNNLIGAMINAAAIDPATGRTKKLAYLSVLGYSDTVSSLLTPDGSPIDITFLAEHPLGMGEVIHDVYDHQIGDYRQVTQSRPFWIEPRSGGRTQMALALMQARDIAQRWINSPAEPRQAPRLECFPPVIINITDAEHNGEGDPVQIAYDIRRLGTQQGSNLIFTCHFSRDMQQPCVFPSSPNEVMGLHPSAAQMFEMSSVIPEPLRVKAREVTKGRDVPSGARTFVYNADAELLVNFLKWGTIGTGGLATE